MLGALAGDIIGSRFEFKSPQDHNYPLFDDKCRFTDDSVLTVSTMDAIVSQTDYAEKLREYFCRYPYRGYGKMFSAWAQTSPLVPYGSWGNGGAMRVSPIPHAFKNEDRMFEEVEKNAACTHGHEEGVIGAKAVAYAIWLARNGAKKHNIKVRIEKRFGYDLSCPMNFTFSYIEGYNGVKAKESVPRALQAFVTSQSFEHSIRRAIAIGGDSDTIASITGAISEAFYGIPKDVEASIFKILPPYMAGMVKSFYERYVGVEFDHNIGSIEGQWESAIYQQVFHYE